MTRDKRQETRHKTQDTRRKTQDTRHKNIPIERLEKMLTEIELPASRPIAIERIYRVGIQHGIVVTSRDDPSLLISAFSPSATEVHSPLVFL